MDDDDYLLGLASVFFLVYLLFLTTLVLSCSARDLFIGLLVFVGHRALLFTSDFNVFDLFATL